MSGKYVNIFYPDGDYESLSTPVTIAFSSGSQEEILLHESSIEIQIRVSGGIIKTSGINSEYSNNEGVTCFPMNHLLTNMELRMNNILVNRINNYSQSASLVGISEMNEDSDGFDSNPWYYPDNMSVPYSAIGVGMKNLSSKVYSDTGDTNILKVKTSNPFVAYPAVADVDFAVATVESQISKSKYATNRRKINGNVIYTNDGKYDSTVNKELPNNITLNLSMKLKLFESNNSELTIPGQIKSELRLHFNPSNLIDIVVNDVNNIELRVENLRLLAVTRRIESPYSGISLKHKFTNYWSQTMVIGGNTVFNIHPENKIDYFLIGVTRPAVDEIHGFDRLDFVGGRYTKSLQIRYNNVRYPAQPFDFTNAGYDWRRAHLMYTSFTDRFKMKKLPILKDIGIFSMSPIFVVQTNNLEPTQSSDGGLIVEITGEIPAVPNQFITWNELELVVVGVSSDEIEFEYNNQGFITDTKVIKGH